MKLTIGGLIALALSLVPSQAAAGGSQGKSASRDSYALVRGHSISMSGSIDELDALRSVYGGDFLWIRRAGSPYLIRDPQLLEQATGLFETLRELEPEQAALAHEQDLLDGEQERLDREQERIESESERLSDEESDAPAVESPDRELDQAQRALDKRQANLARRQRDIDAVDRELDRTEERLEKEAEAALWKIIDRAIDEGTAAPISR
jgi:hypothetical protein